MKAILLISHGSRLSQTKEEVIRLLKRLKKESQADIFEYAFLEIEEPSISEGIDICARKGAKEIILALNFLNAGRHVDIDIPKIIRDARRKYPAVSIRSTISVGQHPGIVSLFLDMIK